MTAIQETAFHVQLSCLWEVLSRKVGNVHPHARFERTSYHDFLLSAAAVGGVFASASGGGIGQLILQAVTATREAVKQNTNLGILLLLGPLSRASTSEAMRALLPRLTVQDAADVYEAIRRAQPGGLGQVQDQDVHAAPSVTLTQAMALAADRDLIARQYATEFHEIFHFGVPALTRAFAEFRCVEAAVITCQLHWLAEFPDSLIARKTDLATAQTVQQQAQQILNLGGLSTSEGRQAGRALDQHLRSEGNRLNPGTTADLVTACLFVMLQDHTLKSTDLFCWTVPDWL